MQVHEESYSKQTNSYYTSNDGVGHGVTYSHEQYDPGTLRSHDVSRDTIHRTTTGGSCVEEYDFGTTHVSHHDDVINASNYDMSGHMSDFGGRPSSRQSTMSRHSEPGGNKLPKTNSRRDGSLKPRESPEPASKAFVEEERINADGSTSIIRRAVTARTTMTQHEHDMPKIEVHISPATETIISPPTSPQHGADFNESHHHNTNNNFSSNSQYVDQHYVLEDDYAKSSVGGGLYTDNKTEYVDNNSSNNNLLYTDVVHQNNVENNVYNDEFNIINSVQNNEYNIQNNEYNIQNNVQNNTINNEYNQANTLNYNESILGGGGVSMANQNNNLNLSEFDIIDAHDLNQTSAGQYNHSTMSQHNSQQQNSSTLQRNGMQSSNAQATVSESLDLKDLLMFLKTGDTSLKANAAGYVMHLAYENDNVKKRVYELDMIPLLVQLMLDDDEDCHRNASGALKNLSYGKFVNDNKMAILECGGVEACTKLLFKTSAIEVREHVTGILYNISSVKSISNEILDEALEAVAVLVIIPLSGWERELAEIGRKPDMVTWSILLRNSTGVVRNVSSIGKDARIKMRQEIEGLVDALVWIVRAGVEESKQDPENGVINNKVIENVVCSLRNLSYNVDEEIDRNVYVDAVKVPVDQNDGVNKNNKNGSPDNNKYGSPDADTISRDYKSSREYNDEKVDLLNQDKVIVKRSSKGGEKGFLGMKKKPYVKKKKGNKNNNNKKPLTDVVDGTEKPPQDEFNYLVPVRENQPTPLGVELLWQQDIVTLYTIILQCSFNPVTLEAAAASIHNLCAGSWNWSALLRIHVRIQKGLPPIGDLLTVDQQYVVRAVAYALRNLSINKKNKWSIGNFTHRNMLSVLPRPDVASETKPSEYTICAVLSALQALVYKHHNNSTLVMKEGGVKKLVGLSKLADANEKKLRVYSKRTNVEANKVLLYMWEFDNCRSTIKELGWDKNKASLEVKNEKKTSNKDIYAEMERNTSNTTTTEENDRRRFVEDEMSTRGSVLLSARDVGYGEPASDSDVNKPLVVEPHGVKKWYKRNEKNGVKKN